MRGIVLCSLALAAVPARAQSVRRLDGSSIGAAEIDRVVERSRAAAHVPGVGLAIFNDGKIVYEKTYGQRDTKAGLPLTIDSVMTAASLSKAAFASVVMQLVRAGMLDLDRPVWRYLPKPLPEYAAYRDLANDERWRTITARMLLSHTSGLPNWRSLNDDGKLAIAFTPGTRFAYSGEGIDLLQLVVEQLTRTPLEQLMQQRLFSPLGMNRSSMVWQRSFESDYANGYDESGRSLGPQRRPAADAAGSLQTTLKDFARFMQSIVHNLMTQDEATRLMLSPQIAITAKHEFPTLRYEPTDENKAIQLSYALGWGRYVTPFGRAFFKEGHTDGFRNYTVMFENGIGILVMTNSENGEAMYQELLESLLKNTFTPLEWEGFPRRAR